MRLRILTVLLAVILIPAILVSCRTASEPGFSDDDYDYTLHLVLDQSQEQALSELFMGFNEYRETMVPDRWSAIPEMRSEIPGMERLIRLWTETSTLFILQTYASFTDYAETLKTRIAFENPKAIFESGETSVSDYYRARFRTEMAGRIAVTLEGLDFSTWHEVVIQYNAWAATRNLLNDGETEAIVFSMDPQEEITVFSNHFADLFFEHLASAEALIRTTPDPDMDNVEAQVLGLV